MEPLPNLNRSHSRRSGLCRAWILSVSLALALLPGGLRAAIQFDAFLGLDGYVPEGSWFPIVCEVYNDGSAFNGIIEVKGSLGQSGYDRLVPVELPTGTRKRITIPVFNRASYNNVQWDVRLKDANGKVRVERPNLRPNDIVHNGGVLLGTLSRQMNWKPPFREPVRQQNDYKPVAARFLPPLFPDNPIVLEGMKALYLSSERASDLRAQQVAAINSWINSGGHLIVGVDQISDVNSLHWLHDLVPVKLSGVKQVTAGGSLEDWLRSPVEDSVLNKVSKSGNPNANDQKQIKVTMEAPYSDTVNDATFDAAELSVVTGKLGAAKTVVEVGGVPLIVTTTKGIGRVSVLLFSPEREPFKSWRNQSSFWSRITQAPPRIYALATSFYQRGPGLDGVFGAMVDSRQVRKLPIGWLFLMLLAYLAIIGPVDQIWLRKIGKPMLTWITFPCYVALFSGLIYVVGYKLRAGESEWNELHVVDVFQSGAQTEMRGRTFGSVYSPVNQRYAFETKADAAAFRSEYYGSWNTSGNDRGQIVQSESAFRADVFVPVWTCQLYVSDWLRTGNAPFFASVEKTAVGWKAAVQNMSNKSLTHVRLVIDGNIWTLADVPARQMKEFTQSGDKDFRSLGSFVSQYDGKFQEAVQQRRSAFGGSQSGRLDNWAENSIAASFLAHNENFGDYNSIATLPTFDLSAASEQNNAILLAWVDGQAPMEPMNRFTPRRKQASTLWRMTLPLPSNP